MEIKSLEREALESGEIEPLRDFVTLLGSHALADSARLRLAQLLAESEQLLEAELILKPLVDAADPSLAAR